VVDALGASGTEVLLERPRDPTHGDLATNVALQLAKPLKRPPRELAETILAELEALPGLVSRSAIAGPGFINFWLADSALADVLRRVLVEGDAFGRSSAGSGRRVNVEFVSANPTGPLHVGHGRGAALGDAVASLLQATGHEVMREFYVNDAGLQVERLAASLWARVQQAVGREAELPEGGYHGQYLEELAQQVLAREGATFADLSPDEGLRRCRDIAVEVQRDEQDRDLADFGVRFDVVFRESQLYQGDDLQQTLAELEAKGLAYEQDGAVWLRTSGFGDEKDRVLRKQDGSFTYFLPDLAYHHNKAERGFDRAIDVWGADHHGYVPRMQAALRALGIADDFFHAMIVQLVRVMRHGQEVRFSKRTGEFVTAQGRRPVRVRHRSGHEAVGGEPGVLRAVRPYAHGGDLPHRERGAGACDRHRRRPVAARRGAGAGPHQAARRAAAPGGAGGRGVGAASHHRLSGGDRPAGERLVSPPPCRGGG
jgi:arginyl-tRNA synthetase